MNVSMETPYADQRGCPPEDTEIQKRSRLAKCLRIVALVADRSDAIVDIGFPFLIFCYLLASASLWLR